MRWAALACLAAVAGLPSAARADDLAKVSCRDRGKVVYLANVRQPAVAAATAEALASFPGALCVALGAEPPPESSAPGAAGDIASVLGGATAASPQTTGTSGLDAALRALRGDAMRVAVPAAAPTPVPATSPAEGVVYRAVNYDAMQPQRPDWARLAVYSDADAEVALADWDRIVAADPATFAALTPDVRVSDGAVLLGAGPVPVAERAPFCLAASALSLDCRFGDAPRRPETAEALDMADAAPGPAMSPRVPDLDEEVDVACPGATAGHLACWASPYALAEADALPRPEARPTEAPVAAPRNPGPATPASARRRGRGARLAGR